MKASRWGGIWEGNDLIRPDSHGRRAPVRTKSEEVLIVIAVRAEPVSKSRQRAECCRRTISKNGEDFYDDHDGVIGAGS